MAAGDLILTNTSLTPEDLQKIAAETEKLLAADSKEPNEFEEVHSLADLTSLPALQLQGAVYKLVRVSLQLLKGLDGKQVELQKTATAIQWRYTDGSWIDLVQLPDIKGDKGDKGENVVLRATDSAIEWKYANEEDSQYKKLVDLANLKGATGDYYEFRVEGTKLQKRLSEDTSGAWQDILDLTTLYGKTPILETVEVTNGETPSGTFTKTGDDENGNPKYKLALTVQAGKDGQPPVFEHGNTETISSDLPAEVEVVPNGETPEGNPQYLLNFKIPKGQNGQDGQGAGNVYVPESGLLAAKKYLFQPSQNDSANGTFVEYVEPNNFPEAPDDGKVYGRNGQTQSWQEITPEAEVGIQDTAPAEEDDEKLIFEVNEEEDFYVDTDAPADGESYARKDNKWVKVEAESVPEVSISENAPTVRGVEKIHYKVEDIPDYEPEVFVKEAPKDDKVYGRKNGGWTEVSENSGGSETFFIPSAIMSMTSDTPSAEVLAALGGMAGFEKLVEAAKAKNVGLDYEVTVEQIPVSPIKYRVPVLSSMVIDTEIEGIKATMMAFYFNTLDMEAGMISLMALSFERQGDDVSVGSMIQKFPNLPSLDLNDVGLKGFHVRSYRIDVVDLDSYFNRIYTSSYEPYTTRDGDIWIQTT